LIFERLQWVVSGLWRRLLDFRLGNLICSTGRLHSNRMGRKIKRETWMSADLQKIGFGGGCHWCTEAVFASLRGVNRVEQGFIGSNAPDDGLSEGVILTFQPAKISLRPLIEIHLRTHASTSNHAMRQKYRSAVYAMHEAQAEAARRVLAEIELSFDAPLITRVLPFQTFKASDERFQRYAEKNAGGPFCTAYIDPKLTLLRAQFSSLLNPDFK
jgi:peptide-methionine (S)-S-oxide reductase